MAQFGGDGPKLRSHWLRTPLYRAVAAILVMLAISGLLILFIANNPIEVIFR